MPAESHGCDSLARRGSEDTMDAAQALDPIDGQPEGLSRKEHEILAFERQWWRYAGAKEQAIREQFGISATRYYQALNNVIDRPEALAADPMLVKRLRRLRSGRPRGRAARRLRAGPKKFISTPSKPG